MGQVFEALLVLLEQGDIGKNADELRNLASAIADRGNGQQFDEISPDFSGSRPRHAVATSRMVRHIAW